MAITKVGDTDLVQRGILISKYIDHECDYRERMQAEFLILNDEWCQKVYIKHLVSKDLLESFI